MNFLFICNGNINRSPTFERYFKKNFPELKVKSAGTYYGYPNQVNKKILEWADKIYVMDLSQEIYIVKRFGSMYSNNIEVIGVSDQYQPDEEELLDLIRYWVVTRGID